MVEVNFIVFQLLTKLMEHDMWFNNNEKNSRFPQDMEKKNPNSLTNAVCFDKYITYIYGRFDQ